MQQIIEYIIAESRYLRYPEGKPVPKTQESKDAKNIDLIKAYIPQIIDSTEKGDAYQALGFLGKQCKIDQSNYILDKLLKEKNPKTISAALTGLNASQVSILNRVETMKIWLASRNSRLRQSAITAMILCEPDWPIGEQVLIDYCANNASKADKFWMVWAFNERGTTNCLATLQDAFEIITDGDGVNYILMAAKRIAPKNMVDLFIKALITKKDSFTKGLAIDGLIASKSNLAIEQVMERAKKILKKNNSGYFIDYLDGHSELQAALMYLQLFQKENSQIPIFFDWVKTKRLHYMDAPTRTWAETNL